MNKIIIVVLVLLLGVGGYFYLSSRGSLPNPSGTMTGNQTGGNAFDSIKDALSKSMSLKCVYKDDKGVETTTYIKGGAVRIMMAAVSGATQPDNIIMKDQKMHMWSSAGKTGFTYSVEAPENISPFPTTEGQTGNAGNGAGQENILAEIEKYRNACKTETVADSMFEVPSDVNFQDMDSLRQQMMNGATSIPAVSGVMDWQGLGQ